MIRPAAVSGLFYTDDSKALCNEVFALVKIAQATLKESSSTPKAIIVPHAGYIYSGPIAAVAYALLLPHHSLVRRVVLLGPTHHVPLRGMAISGATGFATPMGVVPVDLEAVKKIAELPQVVENESAHAMEHSLEVQLPFLQTVLDDFSLIPLAVGETTPEEVAEVLEQLWGGAETLIVVSSDLSHFLPYRNAVEFDQATARQILEMDWTLKPDQACGCMPVNGLLMAAKKHGLKQSLLDLRNSGDTAGSKDRVVGYGAFAFS